MVIKAIFLAVELEEELTQQELETIFNQQIFESAWSKSRSQKEALFYGRQADLVQKIINSDSDSKECESKNPFRRIY